LNLGYYT